jgi:signal peptide peptidase SppA
VSEKQKNAEQPGTWLGEIEGHLWAMRPEALATLCNLAANGLLGAQIEADVEAAKRRGRPAAISGGVTTVSLKGVLAPVGGLLALFFDIPNPLDVFREGMREALANPDVGAIVIEIDSPGGVVDGIPEMAAELRAMRGSKPIVAHANTLAASAAYWLASQADEVITTPSGAVGSIGVYATHRDMSGAMKMMGVETTLISAGKYKTDGSPFQPLSDGARAHIQEDVDHFYGLFTADVARGRDVKQADVKSGYGEGRVLNAKAALAVGLVDRVETIGETVARLSSRSRGTTATTGAEGSTPERQALEEAEADARAIETSGSLVYSEDERKSVAEIYAALGLDRTHDAVGV